MAAAYDMDLREKVIQALDQKKYLRKEIAEVFAIDVRTIYNWDQRRQKMGTIQPLQGNQGGHNQKITDLIAFRKFVENNASSTRAELAEKWGHGVSVHCIGRMIKKIGFTIKKNSLATKNGMRIYESHINRK